MKKRRKDLQGDSDDEGADEEDAFFRSLAAQDKIPKYVELLKFKVSAVFSLRILRHAS